VAFARRFGTVIHSQQEDICMHFPRHPLAMAMKLIVASVVMTPVLAQNAPANPDPTITVITVLGVDENAGKIVAPFSIVDTQELFERGGTLGDLLNGLPGVHADSF